jgi:pilus assembly protein CpaE
MRRPSDHDGDGREAVARRAASLAAVLRTPAAPAEPADPDPAEQPDAASAGGQLHPVTAPPHASAEERGEGADQPARGEVVAVYSPKGGVGTSFLASRLALAAARFSGLRTVLVDLDPNRGDAATLVLEPVRVRIQRSALELAKPAARRPAASDLAGEHPCGLHVLAPLPLDPAGEQFDARAVTGLLDVLRASYALAVVDVPAAVDDSTVAALAAADRVLLVTVPEEHCVQRVRRLVRALRQHQTPLERMGVWHNMDDPGSGADAELVAHALDLPLVATVPFDHEGVQAAINTDQDPADQLGVDPVSRAICELAGQLWPAPAPLNLPGSWRPERPRRRRR